MDDLLDKVTKEIQEKHNKILDDWCKAVFACNWVETGCINPQDLALTIEHIHKNDSINIRYRFEPRLSHS